LNENAGAGLCKISSSLSAVAPAMGRRRPLASGLKSGTFNEDRYI